MATFPDDPVGLAKQTIMAPRPERQVAPSGLYSQGAEAAAALPQAKGSPQQFKSTLTNPKYNVKPAEFENSQFDQAFAGRPSVTRDEVAQHFQNAMPQVEETVLGVPHKDLKHTWNKIDQLSNELYDAGITEHTPIARGTYNPEFYPPEYHNAIKQLADAHKYVREQADLGRTMEEKPTKYGQYTLPGGENYREVLLKYGERPEAKMERAKSYVRPDIWERMTDEQRQQYLATPDKGLFQSSHWREDPNVLAHLRLADRTGPNGEKILHVEEIQSDWGQKGKKEGFVDPKDNMQDLVKEYDYLTKQRRALEVSVRNGDDADPATQAAVSRLNEVNNSMSSLSDRMTAVRSNIPTAPYVTSTPAWTDLALKRALKEAAEGGYDKMIWTPGAEQAKRYSLSNQVDKLKYIKQDDGTYSVIPYKDGEPLHHIERDNIPEKELDTLFGRDVADKMRAYEGDVDGNIRSLSGQDLSVGGEGMKGYYDKIVPKRLQELIKRHDPEAKVGEHEIPNSGDKPRQGHAPVGDIMNWHPSYSNLSRQEQSARWNEMSPTHRRRLINDYETSQSGDIVGHGIEITPKMRESILKGQPAFKRGGAVPLHPALNIPGVHIRTAEAGEPIFHGEK